VVSPLEYSKALYHSACELGHAASDAIKPWSVGKNDYHWLLVGEAVEAYSNATMLLNDFVAEFQATKVRP
jgi:hypothetical protein